MQSLLQYDCLPRLMDAAVSNVGPDLYMLRSWLSQLSDQRLSAEKNLGYNFDSLRNLWTSQHKLGFDKQKLFALPPNSKEFASVATMFASAPREEPAYNFGQG